MSAEFYAIAHVADKSKMSLAEKRWNDIGYLFLENSPIVGGASMSVMIYEPITFHLPGESYTPDFMMIFSNGWVVFVEIKESEYAKGYRDSRSKLRAAASVYTMFTFVMAKYNRKTGVFEIEVIKDDGKDWNNTCPGTTGDRGGMGGEVGNGERPASQPVRSTTVERSSRAKKTTGRRKAGD